MDYQFIILISVIKNISTKTYHILLIEKHIALIKNVLLEIKINSSYHKQKLSDNRIRPVFISYKAWWRTFKIKLRLLVLKHVL